MSLRKKANLLRKPECFDRQRDKRDRFRKSMNSLRYNDWYNYMILSLDDRYWYSDKRYHAGFAKIDLKDKDKG